MINRCAAIVALLLVTFAGMPSTTAIEPLSIGLNQLVVIKPGAHEQGLPAVRLEPGDHDGTVVVDIPPTLHVHRYFYDGDREYQGPIVEGGPTTVVANHPKTGKRMYVNVTLPAGAPTIAYSGSTITYVYPDRRVRIKFCRGDTDGVVVDYFSGQGVRRRASEMVASAVQRSKSLLSRSSTLQSVADVAGESRQTVMGVTSAADSTVSKLLDGAKSLMDAFPGVTPLKSMGDSSQQQAYQARLRGLTRQLDTEIGSEIRTNR
ncbi:hypothetical protein Enr13x_08570 [Stieleria neptunia]|uniref:Uncharacterized protein n=1 Tax=Stieleria neptunia TaxID=2527979 RepID=A0A518HJM8_9BACT|nr:hypothetical protein [Stieleria neptunia]QDV41019.1 hypothetical protein Enr13x_08570 [Stieleria neptunia]